MSAPTQPKIYHITHIDRLPAIIADDALWSDAIIAGRPRGGTSIGMSTIKQRRLKLPVKCHPNTCVGDYVPFYFCPRSVMLYVIYRQNHPDLAYRGGQEPIVHLEADLGAVLDWAKATGRRWAFSLSNAGAMYAEFRTGAARLNEVNWEAVSATDFRSPEVREGKQAEFLVHTSFPWHLVARIGVCSNPVARQAVNALRAGAHRPAVEIRPEWYY